MPKKKIQSDRKGTIITIPRKFRWTLTSKTHPDVYTWMTHVELDMLNHHLRIKVLESQDLTTLYWINSLGHRRPQSKYVDKDCHIITEIEEVVLTSFDGNGGVLSQILFKGLGFEYHSCKYDYASNDALTHELIISFRDFKMLPKTISDN